MCPVAGRGEHEVVERPDVEGNAERGFDRPLPGWRGTLALTHVTHL
jgi:hypothetical protein